MNSYEIAVFSWNLADLAADAGHGDIQLRALEIGDTAAEEDIYDAGPSPALYKAFTEVENDARRRNLI